MNNALRMINDSIKEKKICLSEEFYLSTDIKTIMGEVTFNEILFLDYRETEAGSNPREYIGLKKANVAIIRSLLKDYQNMFRFLHSGLIVSLINPIVDKTNRIVRYDDCCLTNGNQTRFIILILTLLKLIFDEKELKHLSQKEFNEFVKKYFDREKTSGKVISRVKFAKVKEIISFLLKNNKYLISFNNIKLEDFLNSKIRIQINLINSIVDDLEEELDEYSAGTLIAEANNDTQKVKADDIFGNKYKRDLESKIFKDFINKYQKNVRIEYRLGEIIERGEKVHILTLLRPVVATGILTKEKKIFRLTNQRDPIYKLFERLFRKQKNEEAVDAISKLIPLLFKLRNEYVKIFLESHRRKLVRIYKEKAIMGDLDGTVIEKEIAQVKNDDSELERLIKKSVNFNIEHILPVLVFRIRNLITEDEDSGELKLNVPDDIYDSFISTLAEVIYERYVELKLKGLPSSLTTLVRSEEFYNIGSEAYKTFQRTSDLKESNYISDYRLRL